MRFCILALILSGICLAAGSEENKFSYGSIVLTNQFGESTAVYSRQVLVYAADRTGGDNLHSFLKEQRGTYLSEKKALYIMDRSMIPSLIFNYLILPVLKNYNYPVYIVNSKKQVELFPVKKEKVSFIFLQHGRVDRVVYIASVNKKELHVMLSGL